MPVKRWVVKNAGDEAAVNHLAEALNVDSTLASLLVQRGIRSFDEAKAFFRPELHQLHDPFLMKDMEAALVRIDQAMARHEKILIYGDYDVDGTTAVSLVYTFFKRHYPHIDYYIPDRYSEGYGISFKGIDFARENDFSLIIALDCGIKSVEHVAYARARHIDFIICDHHLAGDELPMAAAILNPKQKDCTYPYNELSGCGIGFKLVQAYALKHHIPQQELEQYLDLVAVSIAADIVPITGENRVLAHYGLKRLNASPRHGLKAILDLNQVKKELTITDLVFIIGPRINAAGRIESGKRAVELLISENETHAKNSGMNINDRNTERKNLDVLITQQALQMLESTNGSENRKTTVLFHSEWHKGVIGIVASRLTEKYYRPTIVLTESNGKVTGSARSVKDFDVYTAIEACSDLLEQFGGHKYAAGLTLKPENLEAFQQRFEEIVSASIKEHLLVPEIEIDAALQFRDITPKFFRILKQFSPFGPGNMAPVFITENVKDKGYARVVGKEHIRLDLVQDSISYPAIGFGLGRHLDAVSRGTPFSICYCIEENEWNGKVSLQLNIKDIKYPA